ncbi:electron transport complex subunit RsxD [Edwardsiella ictaluri]|uniref:electron transport complex subunit RsxD n=1 Tax=Edwardsiella ictaluri TaxID=67780 RepID=UPI0037843299
MAFRIASSPFTHNRQNTGRIMFWVVAAALPGIVVQIYFFGYGTLIQLTLAILTACLCEALVLRLRRRPLSTLGDNSALLTGLLLGISLPPLAPWWLVVLGSAFAIIIAKQLYGGLGQNPFNPAMVGYVMLLIAFPVPMTTWLPPQSLLSQPLDLSHTLSQIFSGHAADLHALLSVDGVSSATPLDSVKTGLRSGQTLTEIFRQPIWQGELAGLGWQWVNAGFLLGGLLPLLRRIIHWQIPLGFLAAMALCAALGSGMAPQSIAPPLTTPFSGATMLGAFFIATDPVTAATTPRGRLIFGPPGGVLVWLIRTYGGYPDGVAFAVLLANICVPLIDHYTQPRVYGHR